jgi:hypothetical protein
VDFKGRVVPFPGISHDAIAQESKQYWRDVEATLPGAQVLSLVLFLHLGSLQLSDGCWLLMGAAYT